MISLPDLSEEINKTHHSRSLLVVGQLSAVMIFTELRNSTALGNRLTGLPHKEPAAGEVTATISNV